MKIKVSLTINGQPVEREVDTRVSLVEFLRDELRLTGAHVGCRTGNCGACTVLLDGETVKSCCVLTADVDGQSVITVEALNGANGELHPLQEVFVENQGLQCGFCTGGMLLSTIKLLQANPKPTEEEIRHAIAGNLCRCTGYQFIFQSIEVAAETVPAETLELDAIIAHAG